jgi:hypothetical protein
MWSGRVDRPLPVLQANVGVLSLPSGFPTVPQYLSYTRVRECGNRSLAIPDVVSYIIRLPV